MNTKIKPKVISFTGGSWLAPGVALVESRPHRTPADARLIAESVAKDPVSYVPALVEFDVPGVTPLPRRTFRPNRRERRAMRRWKAEGGWANHRKWRHFWNERLRRWTDRCFADARRAMGVEDAERWDGLS